MALYKKFSKYKLLFLAGSNVALLYNFAVSQKLGELEPFEIIRLFKLYGASMFHLETFLPSSRGGIVLVQINSESRMRSHIQIMGKTRNGIEEWNKGMEKRNGIKE